MFVRAMGGSLAVGGGGDVQHFECVRKARFVYKENILSPPDAKFNEVSIVEAGRGEARRVSERYPIEVRIFFSFS